MLLTRDRVAGAVAALAKPEDFVPLLPLEPATGSDQERVIRASGTRDRVVASIDASSPITRNLAARVAAGDQGPFHVGQVASVFSHARNEWSYVNDPRGNEYFARASESIENDFVGDCDDFAILLVSMIEAIGGTARVVVSDGERGGHAYAEACIAGDAQRVLTDLRAHYRRVRSRARIIRRVHYRSDARCPVWLNLDWSAEIPGGPYAREDWAVAIHPDGTTETLAPYAPPPS
jgi:hypothetical protein